MSTNTFTFADIIPKGMRTKKKLLIEQLDRKLNPFIGTEKVIVPDQGWINSIRITLNMTL